MSQVHDFDPGITPYSEGLFWTVPLRAPDGVTVNFAAGKAHMTASDLALEDYFDIPNALFRFEDPVSEPATCSFDISWSGPVTDRSPVVDPPGSSGELVMCQATMQWSAHSASGFGFVSDPEGTTSVFAQLGRVSNGVFGDAPGRRLRRRAGPRVPEDGEHGLPDRRREGRQAGERVLT